MGDHCSMSLGVVPRLHIHKRHDEVHKKTVARIEQQQMEGRSQTRCKATFLWATDAGPSSKVGRRTTHRLLCTKSKRRHNVLSLQSWCMIFFSFFLWCVRVLLHAFIVPPPHLSPPFLLPTLPHVTSSQEGRRLPLPKLRSFLPPSP